MRLIVMCYMLNVIKSVAMYRYFSAANYIECYLK